MSRPSRRSCRPTPAKHPLVSESWTGDEVLGTDGFSTTVAKFLATKGKKPTDLQVGQSLDPDGAINILLRLYRVEGVAASDLLTSIIDGWKVDNSDMTVTDTTLAGKPVQEGRFSLGGNGELLVHRRQPCLRHPVERSSHRRVGTPGDPVAGRVGGAFRIQRRLVEYGAVGQRVRAAVCAALRELTRSASRES